MTGKIYNIQRYCLHDGPGIRTTVFLKGCSLSCKWCHNPESQNKNSALIHSKEKCIHCFDCVKTCPNNALTEWRHKLSIEKNRCISCGSCVKACPTDAIELYGRPMNVEEILDVVRRDTVFYRSSNGGVTISGGEPLDQSKFTYELVKSLKTEDYHVALDTSGYADFGVLQKLMPYVDLFLYDVKHVKSKPHQAFTGVDNKKILKNLNRLSKLGCKIWVRIPLIPMFNDSEVDLHDLAYKLADMKIKQICILPYHGYASWKYEKLNQSYDLSGTGRPSDEKLAQAKKIMEDYGMKVKIGG